jgi:antirestriction protein
MYNYDHDCPFEAFITNLGKYNEGELVGEWVKFPTTYEEMQKVFERIHIGNIYEEWFITDYDCYVNGLHDVLGEYESLDKLNYLAASIEAMDKSDFEKFEAAIACGDYAGSVKDLINLTENLNKYDFYPDVHDYDDLGRLFIDEYGSMEIPDHLKNYIDYEAYGRDVALDEGGTFTDLGYIRDTGDSFIEHYEGNRDEIPWEYRVTATAEEKEFIENQEEMKMDKDIDMIVERAFDLDELFRRQDPQYAAAYPNAQASKELIADILLEGEEKSIKSLLEKMAQAAGDNLLSLTVSYEELKKYESLLIVDVDAVRESLEQAQDFNEDKHTMTVIVVEPQKEPYLKELPPGLSALQQEVKGMIGAAYPFDDPVAIICNDEGKLNGMELNRALYDNNGQVYDIVAGPFLVAGLGAEDFTSLSPEMAEKYMEHFKMPEMFVMVDGTLTVVSAPTELFTPDNFLTGEKIETPRGKFSLTMLSQEQMRNAGYGYHHSTDDGRFHIMGNGTRAFAIKNENYLKNAEMAVEDDYNMIDGIINNGQKEIVPPGADDKTSIRDRLAEAKRECAERKPPEVKKPEKSEPERGL